MKKFLRSVGYIFLVLFCLTTIYTAYIIIIEVEDESQGQIYGDLYIFDSKNIFRDYESGKKDLFSVIPWENLDDENFENLPEYPPSNWKQQDYLDTLSIFREMVFQKPSKERFRGAFFYIPDCSEISFGPQSAAIFMSEINFSRATYYSYNIDLKNGNLRYHGNTYEPIISWPIASLNPSKTRITAEQALQIAEQQGGEEFRNANGNQCEINIDISANSHHGNWVVSYDSTIDMFTTLLRLEIDSNSGEFKVLSRGGAGLYSFDPQNSINLLAEDNSDIFILEKTGPENLPDLPLVTWTQENYFQIAKEFNKIVLNEDLDDWKIESITSEFNCDDVMVGLQQMRFSFIRTNLLNGNYFIQDIDINPRTGIIKSSNEYNYFTNRFWLARQNREVINKSWIEIPAEVAMKKVYEEEGMNLYTALKNSGRACQIRISLDNIFGSQNKKSLEWNIGEWNRDYQSLGEEDFQLSAFVNIQTGELRYFKFYGNLNP